MTPEHWKAITARAMQDVLVMEYRKPWAQESGLDLERAACRHR
jgi:hypothetical protein